MPLERDDAIVLRRLDYSETSQVLMVFCRVHGPQRLIAKGIKRGTKTRVAVGVDLLECGTVVYSRRPGSEGHLGTLTEWRQVDLFDHIRRDLPRWYAAQYAAEVTAQLTEEADPHPALFDALRAFLAALASDDPLAALVGYLLDLLREIGLTPQLHACVGCEREFDAGEPVFFTSRQGGVLCRDCEPAAVEKRRVRDAGLPLLRGESSSGAAAALAAFDLLDYHLTETMARPPKLSRPLRDALATARRPS